MFQNHKPGSNITTNIRSTDEPIDFEISNSKNPHGIEFNKSKFTLLFLLLNFYFKPFTFYLYSSESVALMAFYEAINGEN
jgi:hypothetical protein